MLPEEHLLWTDQRYVNETFHRKPWTEMHDAASSQQPSAFHPPDSQQLQHSVISYAEAVTNNTFFYIDSIVLFVAQMCSCHMSLNYYHYRYHYHRHRHCHHHHHHHYYCHYWAIYKFIKLQPLSTDLQTLLQPILSSMARFLFDSGQQKRY